MSTTVNYKGSSIATVNNATKTLTTAGKWLEGDIEIVDVTEGGAASITDETNTTGTTAVIDGTDASAIVSDYRLSETALGSDGSVDLSEAIGALTTYSNEVTGVSDSTLSDAVGTLVDGYTGLVDALLTRTLTSYVNDRITYTGEAAFQGCNQMTYIWLPNLTDIAQYTFNCCTKLQTIVLPSVTQARNNSMQNCTMLEAVDLSVCTAIGTNAFYGSSRIDKLIIRTGSVCSLANIGCFTNTPFASGKTGGTLYVPQTLISQYTQAANWSAILGYPNNSIQAIEGSQYENYYADGTAIS